jgi:hypothetical protein
MSDLVDCMAQLFSTNGWRVQTKSHDPLLSRFGIVAENDIAIVFGAEIAATELSAASSALAATIAAVMSPRGDPKVWEAYLLLAVGKFGMVPEDELIAVQRDLNYCRRFVVDSDAVRAGANHAEALKRQLLLLFPFAPTELEGTFSVERLLEDCLVSRGNDPRVVEDLVRNLNNSHFDPIAFLADTGSPSEAG